MTLNNGRTCRPSMKLLNCFVGSVKVLFASAGLHVDRLLSWCVPKFPEKNFSMSNERLPPWVNWKHQGSGQIDKRPSGRQKPKTKNQNKSWEWKGIHWRFMGGIHADFTGMSEGGEVSSFHVHRQLDHFVFIYPTTLSSSHASRMASSRVSMILFSHEVTNFQVHLKTQAGALWNVLLCFCVSLSVEMFALGLKRHNTKECKVRPHHDTHIVFLPAQGGLHTNTLPTPHNETGDRALCRSKHNRDSAWFFLQNHEFILICTRQGLILYSRWVAVATAQVLAFTVSGRHFK